MKGNKDLEDLKLSKKKILKMLYDCHTKVVFL